MRKIELLAEQLAGDAATAQHFAAAVRARQWDDERRRGCETRPGMANAALACKERHLVTQSQGFAGKLKQILPPVAVMAAIVVTWWIVVVVTESPIFPTPWQVIAGALELARDGTLWREPGRT